MLTTKEQYNQWLVRKVIKTDMEEDFAKELVDIFKTGNVPDWSE